jgi:uncharacterized membrane protein HdeD (DUF308 family)
MNGFDGTETEPLDPGRGPYGVTPGGRLLEGVANHWGLVVLYGVASAVLGIILAVWPGETLVVCAVLVAIQLIISGALRLIIAIAGHGLDGGLRAVVGLSGALALVVGLLCLRDPVQTVVIIGLLLGVWWVVAGIVDILSAILAPVPGRRGWDIATGLISLAAGAFLLIDPKLTLGALVVVACIWLIAIGVMAIVAGLRLRSLHRHGASDQRPPESGTTGLYPVG